MDMQDKELDRLFQQKLDDLEIQPSARVWQGITADLDAGKRKRVLVPFLSAAAGVILLITAGILFIPKHPVKVNDQHHSTQIAQETKAVQQPAIVKNDSIVPPTPAQNKIPANPVIAPVNNLARVNKTKTKNNLTQPIQQPVINEKPTVDARTDEPMLAANTPAMDYHVVKTAPPDTATKISPQLAIINNEKTLIAQIPSRSAPITTKPVKKHRIRSMGDVFNIVIAAVDKRKDKIIEFSNTDEDDAVITGINLGLVKVKKEK